MMFKTISIHSLVIIVLTLGIWVIGFFSEVQNQETVVIWGYPIPPLCLYTNLFDINCWGCGLTRSVVYASQGKLQQSFHMHPFGGLILLILTYKTLQNIRAIFIAKKSPPQLKN